MGLSNLLFVSLRLVLSSVCLLYPGMGQRRWPSCRSTWPCSGRSMWRCSRSWPTQRGAVPCLLLRPLARDLPPLLLQTPSLAVCWTLWPTSISRNSTGEDHGWNGWVRVLYETLLIQQSCICYYLVVCLVCVVWHNSPMLLQCCSWPACHITSWKNWRHLCIYVYWSCVFVFAVTWKWKLQGRSSVPISLCWLLVVMSGVWPTWPPRLNWTYPVSDPGVMCLCLKV